VVYVDPYAGDGYDVPADLTLVSHGHHDHNAVSEIRGLERVIDQPGIYELEDGVRVTAIEADHDEAGGAKRGKTLLFCIEAEGLRVMHMGDLGHVPTAQQCASLGNADVLMVPVGGFYTIDAPTAVEVAELLEARVVLPMHYKTSANADWPIAGIEAYTALCDEPVEFLDLLRVARGDLSCQPASAVLKPTSLR